MAATRSASLRRPPVQATGRVVRDRDGLELLLERRLPITAAESWEWMTSSALLKKWLGKATVLERTAGQRVLADWRTASGVQRATISLVELDGATVLYLRQRLADYREAGSAGPGWEYHLDRLLAAIDGTAMPEPGDYPPAQRPYYERLGLDGDPENWTLR